MNTVLFLVCFLPAVYAGQLWQIRSPWNNKTCLYATGQEQPGQPGLFAWQNKSCDYLQDSGSNFLIETVPFSGNVTIRSLAHLYLCAALPSDSGTIAMVPCKAGAANQLWTLQRLPKVGKKPQKWNIRQTGLSHIADAPLYCWNVVGGPGNPSTTIGTFGCSDLNSEFLLEQHEF
eukprot:TRINITY_DN67248_c7_g1_i1.p1 TRINITY_DN67248_c7_g1~~TRINITY_DN67248_c7_g1_i1.p1  ORF type:complete len:175 (+),score=17.50 TRINITY_DN67248_c7_g1_i1:25-549(+)